MGFGNGDGGGSFGHSGPPTSFGDKGGPPPPFGGIPGFCNLLSIFELDIRHAASPGPGKAGEVTMKLDITSTKACMEKAIKEQAVVQVIIFPAGGSAAQAPAKAKKIDTDACKPFRGIENNGLLDPGDIPGLFKDMSHATDEMGKEFSLGNLLKKICEGTGAGQIVVKLLCAKPLGECDQLNPSDCDEDIKILIDLPGWVNPPFKDLIGRKKAGVDPCKLAKLLACWKEKPKANTSIPIGDQGSIANGLRGRKNPNPPPPRLPVTQGEVDEAGDKTITKKVQNIA